MKCLFCKGLNFNQLIETIRIYFSFGAIPAVHYIHAQKRGIPLPSGLGISRN